MVAEVVDLENDQLVDLIKRSLGFASILQEQGYHPLLIAIAMAHAAGQAENKVLDDVFEIVYPDEYE